MKRALPPLVEYDGSDEEENPPPRKKKLPPLSSSLTLPVPVDNPALHQGRVRTHPHVDGQYATHVYISLRLKPRSAVYQLFQEVISEAKTSVPSLQEISIFEGGENGSLKAAELHISLSRPIYLFAHQREDFKREVMQIAKRQKQFCVSFVAFSELVNDERTRTFLAADIGAGHHELQSLTVELTPVLRMLRQRGYYENPRFHASIAWALLDRGNTQSQAAGTRAEDSIFATRSPGRSRFEENASSYPPTASSSNSEPDFPTIPHFPKDLIPRLNERFSTRLISTKLGLFTAGHVTVKIGKETFLWAMME